MKLSIIVPVYNVERLLPRCLDSLLRQGFEVGEYEIVCVNDGSTDGSAAILAEYAERHPDVFCIITQENQGLSGARNAGMAAAEGQYITFVDSDDYIVDGGYAYIYQHFCQDEPDMVTFWSVTLNDYQLKHGGYTDKPDGKAFYRGCGHDAYNTYPPTFATDKFYKRSFLQEKGLRFENIPICEDTSFCFHLYLQNPTLVMTDCNIYRYTKDNQGSILSVRSAAALSPKIESMLYHTIRMFNDYLESGRTEMAHGARGILRSQLLTFYTRTFSVALPHEQWQKYMRDLRAYPHHDVGMQGKWRLLGWAMNACSSSYLAYSVFSFLYTHVFDRHVRKHLA